MAVKCFVLIKSVHYNSFLIDVNHLEEGAHFSHSCRGPIQPQLLKLWPLTLPASQQHLLAPKFPLLCDALAIVGFRDIAAGYFSSSLFFSLSSHPLLVYSVPQALTPAPCSSYTARLLGHLTCPCGFECPTSSPLSALGCSHVIHHLPHVASPEDKTQAPQARELPLNISVLHPMKTAPAALFPPYTRSLALDVWEESSSLTSSFPLVQDITKPQILPLKSP